MTKKEKRFNITPKNGDKYNNKTKSRKRNG